MFYRLKKISNWILAFTLLAIAVFFILCAYTNVSTSVTPEDKLVFKKLNFDAGLGSTVSFSEQIAIIRKVQQVVFDRAPRGSVGIPDFEPREPADLMRFGQGLCFDRSRTFDKAFRYLGFESRHVYILYKGQLPFWRAISHYGQPSHAVTEVKTSKGWMFVDSNSEWVAITRQGEPLNADAVWRRYSELDDPPPYLQDPWWAIRGMYSRKGQFYGAGIPFPEFNWSDFLAWFVLQR